MAPLEGRYRGVRYRADTGFELRCDDCAARSDGNPIYWPVTLEFWNPSAGMGRCRACWYGFFRKRERDKRIADPAAQRAHDRARYRANRNVTLIKRREYYRLNREVILAKSKVRYRARRDAAA